MNWSEIVHVPKWAPLSKMDVDLISLEDGFFKISDHQYCLAAPYSSMSLDEAPGGPFVTAFLWACSEGAARRAYLYDIENDDKVVALPPFEILPHPACYTYRDIVKGLKALGCKSVAEHAGYRIVTDGSFIHRVIESEIASYYFREPEHDDSEIPYAIQWDLTQIKI